MTVTLEEFTKNFTPEERAKVATRTAELIEEELTLRDLRQTADDSRVPDPEPGGTALADITGNDPLKPRRRGHGAKD